MGAQEDAGHGPEELLAEEFRDHRETGGQRVVRLAATLLR
jgi:hypothetical protein